MTDSHAPVARTIGSGISRGERLIADVQRLPKRFGQGCHDAISPAVLYGRAGYAPGLADRGGGALARTAAQIQPIDSTY